jgi:Holliday junction resolvase RusA-like endonuclease
MIMSTEVEEMVAFTVPYLTPPSVNHAYLPCKYTGKDGYTHTGRKLSKDAKAFKDAVAIFARGRTVAPATDRERRKVKYRVEVDVYLGPNQRLDADNCGKLLCDSLEDAGVIHSDAFVAPFKVTPHKDDRLNPRTEFNVWRTSDGRDKT